MRFKKLVAMVNRKRIEALQPRIETKKGGELVLQVLAAPGVSDGDLAAMLQDAEQDLRWSVVKGAETQFIKSA
ncbi:MAG: hypothetical protein A2075_23350 [Geobacteraceae bacterium GWC2_58_44]|nr:MAG: hypothetical protein A2075_23350 [Geobacteraceae bacterium GWC2_58_44]